MKKNYFLKSLLMVCLLMVATKVTKAQAVIQQDSIINVTCNGGNNGAIYISLPGISFGVTYLWSNGATTQDITGLAAGSYTVNVMGQNGNIIATATFIVVQLPPLAVTIQALGDPCKGGCLRADINGNPLSLTFIWSNGATSPIICGTTPGGGPLPSGTYTVTVTDANGCTGTASYVVMCCHISCPKDTSICFNVPDSLVDIGRATVSSGSPNPGPDSCTYDSIWYVHTGPFNVGANIVWWYVQFAPGHIDSCMQTVTRNPPLNVVVSFTTTPPISGGMINVCLGDFVTFVDNSTGTNGIRDWDFGDGYHSGAQTAIHQYNIAGSFNGSLTVFDKCGNKYTVPFTVVVDPLPGPDIKCPSVVCAGDTGHYSTSVTGCTYLWTIIPPGAGTIIGPNNQQTVNVVWGAGPQGILSLAVTNCSPNNLCTQPAMVVIHITPATLPVGGPTTVCQGATDDYSVECIPGNSYVWSINPATAGTFTGQGTCHIVVTWNPSFTGFATVTVNYHNILTGAGCSLPGACVDSGCGGSGNTLVHVLPIFNISGPATVCKNAIPAPFSSNAAVTSWKVSTTLGVTVATFPTTLAFNGYNWNIATGYYKVTAYALPAGTYCNDSAMMTVQVIDVIKPVLTGQTLVCPGPNTYSYCVVPNLANVTYTYTVVGGTPAVTVTTSNCVTVTWNPGGGVISVSQQLNGVPACNSDTAAIAVSTFGALSLPTVTGPSPICNKSKVTYSFAPALPPQAIYSWSIVPSTAGKVVGPNGVNPVLIEWLTAGPATVQLNISLCGKDSVMFPVIVNALPALPTITAVPSPACKNQPVVFSTTSPGTWNWNFGDPPSGGLNTATTNPAPHTYSISGDYNVQLYVTNGSGCSDTSYTKLHVDSVAPIPVITGPLTVCSSGTSSYSFPSGQQFAGATYTWSLSSTLGTITASTFNTVAIQWAPVIVNTPVTLSLNITSPCLNTSVPVIITINAPPVPVISPPSPVCQGASLPYSAAPLGAATYSWLFAGTPASGQSTNFAFPNAGTQTVDLTVIDGFGCSAKTSVLVDVKPAPTASIFTADPTTFCNPTPINCTLNALNGPGYTFAWFNPAACGTGPTKTVTNGSCGPGNYYVVVTNANLCTASSNVIPISQITCPPPPPGCTPDPYTLTLTKVHVGCTDVNFSISSSINVTNIGISYGGGFGGSTPHTYNLPGIYTVVVSGTVPGLDANGLPCNAVVSVSDTVIIPLIAKFNYEYDCTSGNIQVKLKDQSLFLTGHNITTWNWYTEPGHVFLVSGQVPPLQTIVSGTQVSLDITSSSGDFCSVTNTITIPSPVVAGFTTSTPICVGSPVTFFDNSTLVVPNVLISQLWSFGNAGVTSANASPQYTYPGTGPYTVVYTVKDLYGCIRTATNILNPQNPVTGPITGALTGCGSVTLTAPCNSTYLWSTTATTASINVTTNGSYAVIAYSCDGNGCPFTSAPVNVVIKPIPTAVITGKILYCPGENLDLKTPATAGYSYSWKQIPGGIVGTNSPVLNIPVPPAGVYNYEVTVTLNGCTATSALYSITVDTVPGSAVIDSSGSLTFCQGDSVMLFTNPVGVGYQWTKSPPPQPSPNNTPSIYAKVSGTYGVFVTTANGCAFPPIAPVIVIVNPLPPVKIMGKLVYCEHDTLKLQTSPGYNYLWTYPTGPYSGGNILTINNVNPSNSGQYIVTVTDPLTGCTNADTVLVTVNPAPATPIITANAPLPLCVGQLFIFTVSNVFPPPINYLWNTGQTGTQVPAAIAGSYNVTAINSTTGCKAKSNTLTINPTPDLSCVPTGCYDLCSECIGTGDTITIPGPAGFASYNWQVLVGAVWQNYPPTGSQDLLLTDTLCHNFRLIAYSAAGCSDTSGNLNVCFHTCCSPPTVDSCYERCVYFNDIPSDLHGFGPYIPTAPNVNVTISNVGSQNGQFDKYIRATDLPGPSGIAAGPVFNGMWCCGYFCFDYVIFDDGLAGLSPNIHPKFVIKNAAGKGFMFTAAGTLNETSGWHSFHAPTCLDSIPYDPADGIWSPIAGTTNSDWNSVAGHISKVAFLTDYVADSGAQTGIDNICFIPGSLQLQCFGIPVHCGSPNSGVGYVFVTDTVGCPNFTYHWSTGAVTTTNFLTGLAAGTYCVTVINCCGCADSCCFTVTTEDTLVIHTDTIITVHCPGTSNGGIVVHASGGTPPYTYLWSNNATTQAINNLTAGTYTVTVSCATGCSVTKTVVVTTTAGCVCTPPPPLPTITINSTVPDNCNNTGCIHASFTGCCPLLFSYTYFNPCNPGISFSVAQTTDSAIFCNLPAGNYTLYVTDGCGRTVSLTHVVPLANGPLAGTIQLSNCGTNICLLTTGGCPPYSYQWSNGSTIECASGLTPCAPFVVTVTDSKGCTYSRSGVVPGISFTATNPTCCAANGSLCVNVNCFGNGPYTYTWPDGTSTECATGLSAGTYCVTITNAAGKQVTCCYTLVNAPITPPTVSLHFSCNNSVTAVVNNPCGNYTFQWDNGNTTSLTRNNLIPCHYDTLTITMCDGSVYKRIFRVPQLVPTITPINCLTGIGGICIFPECFDCAPYTYAWSNGATTSCMTTSVSGVYSLCVSNSCGDVICCEYNIPLQNLVVIGQAWAGCYNAHNGYINVTPTGGTGPYTYIWSTNPVKTTANVTGLNPGTYTVTVTASNGCTATATYVIVGATTTMTLNSSKVTVRCGGAYTGSATILPTGGVPPYNYLWNTGENTATISLLAAGTYTCSVTDAFGCTKTKSVSITQNPPLIVIVSPGVNHTATAAASGGVGPYTYLWNTVTPQTTATATGLLASHTYKVKVTDSKNCTKLVAITMPAPREIDPELNSTELIVTAVPNPAQDYVTLKFENTVVGETYTVSFTNMLGELIMETIHKATSAEGSEKVDVGKLPKGIYNLIVKSDTSQKNIRLIIQ